MKTKFNTGTLKLALVLAASLIMTACGGNGNVSSGGGSDQARIASVNVTGEWVGNVPLNGQTEFLVLSLRQSSDNGISAHLYSRAGGADYNLKGTVSGYNLSMSGSAGSTAQFKLESDPTASFLNGRVVQSGSTSSVQFERL